MALTSFGNPVSIMFAKQSVTVGPSSEPSAGTVFTGSSYQPSLDGRARFVFLFLET